MVTYKCGHVFLGLRNPGGLLSRECFTHEQVSRAVNLARKYTKIYMCDCLMVLTSPYSAYTELRQWLLVFYNTFPLETVRADFAKSRAGSVCVVPEICRYFTREWKICCILYSLQMLIEVTADSHT